MDNELLVSGHSALAEAKVLYGLVLRGTEGVEEIRELISVPPKTERILRMYMRQSQDDAWWIERAIKFRADVLREFERLVDHRVIVGHGLEESDSDLLEVEEPERGPCVEAMAFAQP